MLRSIAVIEPETVVCRLVAQVLKGAGHEVQSASSSAAATALLREFSPDTVVLAWEVTRWIEAEERLRAALSDVPVRVVLGARGEAESSQHGVVLYLPKPFSLAALRAAVLGNPSP